MTHFVMTKHLVMGKESGDIVDRRTFTPGLFIHGIGYLGRLWDGPNRDLPTEWNHEWASLIEWDVENHTVLQLRKRNKRSR